MIYDWLSSLIGFEANTGQSEALIEISGILVVLFSVVTLDMIFSLLYHLIKKGRYR